MLSLLAVNYVIMAVVRAWAGAERADSVQQPDGCSRVPAAGRQGQRRARQDAGRDGRRGVQEGGPLPGRQGRAGEELRDRDPVVRDLQQRRADELLAGQARSRSRRADQRRARVLREPDPRLRPGDPAGRPVHLALAARDRRADGRDRRVRALARASRRGRRHEGHVQGRRGHRRGQGRADRGRRLPQEPREVPEARRPDSARRAARGPARHRQDAARPRGRGRGGRAVLLHQRVGVRRGDRRHRRLARARPVQAGQGSRAGDHLHRRARRHRALALGRQHVRRRQRRARADAQPDPHRDGRLRAGRHGDRGRRRPTAPRSSTPRCCAPAASTAA